MDCRSSSPLHRSLISGLPPARLAPNLLCGASPTGFAFYRFHPQTSKKKFPGTWEPEHPRTRHPWNLGTGTWHLALGTWHSGYSKRLLTTSESFASAMRAVTLSGAPPLSVALIRPSTAREILSFSIQALISSSDSTRVSPSEHRRKRSPGR